MTRSFWLMATALAVGPAHGQQLPDVPWKVHDMERPRPPKVEVEGAVHVPPPGDATVLFDGESLDAWKGDWKVEEGVLIASPGDLQTVEAFGDCQLHVEWRIPAERKVDGQQGGNSGIFLMDRYEIQVMESFDNETYADGQAGAIYAQTPPLVNASAPQGEWQSYDIVFKAPVYEGKQVKEPAKVTVIHNGVVLHHARAFLGPTRHKKVASYPEEHPGKAPLRLQWHGDPIEYRNIWIRELGEYDAGEAEE